jgi:predicted benzoate:H+ symporter BenE
MIFEGVLSVILRIVFEAFVEIILGYTGHCAIWILTFGKVDLPPDSTRAALIGIFVFLGILVSICIAMGYGWHELFETHGPLRQ